MDFPLDEVFPGGSVGALNLNIVIFRGLSCMYRCWLLYVVLLILAACTVDAAHKVYCQVHGTGV